jgi:hypothetical protein
MAVTRLALGGAVVAFVGIVCGVGEGARATTTASCGVATPLKGAPILRLGPVRLAGFSSDRCAEIALGCGAKDGGYEATLSLELSRRPASPIVLRAAQSEAVRFVLIGSTAPAPKVPRCLPASRSRAQASLEPPDMYYVLFIFVPRPVAFHLTARRNRHLLGAAVIAAR